MNFWLCTDLRLVGVGKVPKFGLGYANGKYRACQKGYPPRLWYSYLQLVKKISIMNL